MTVTQKEIVEALRAYDKAMVECGYELAVDKTVADRIEAEGIKPPEGYAIVPIITEATPFSCGINGDPPQVDNAWTPPCKVWCGRKQCAAKEST